MTPPSGDNPVTNEQVGHHDADASVQAEEPGPDLVHAEPVNVEDVGSLLVAEAADADVFVTGIGANPGGLSTARGSVAMGDVDGDGYGDWVSGGKLVYGGPRPVDNVFVVSDTATLSFPLGEAYGHSFSVEPGGDINGDGLADIIFNSGLSVAHSDVPDGQSLASRNAPWTAPTAFILFGSSARRVGLQDLPRVALGFGDRDQLATRFSTELASGELDTMAYQDTVLKPLGDVDRDGYADFSLTTIFGYVPGYFALDQAEKPPRGEDMSRAERVSYIYYGSSALSVDVAPGPAARLPDIHRWAPAGDVNGDDYPDVLLSTAEHHYVLAGGRERLEGELILEGRAVRVTGIVPGIAHTSGSAGDLDGDGYGDFLLGQGVVVKTPYDVEELVYVFYGARGLLAGPLDVRKASAVFDLRQAGSLQPMGDWNGDGRADLLLDHWTWPSSVSPYESIPPVRSALFLRGLADRLEGKYNAPLQRPEIPPSSFVPVGLMAPFSMVKTPAGDLDNDGFDDLLITFLTRGEYDGAIKYGSSGATSE